MRDQPRAVPPGLGNLVKDYPMSRARIREILLLMLFSAGMSLGCFLPAIFSSDASPDGIRTRIGITLPGLLMALPAMVGVRQLLVLRGSSLSLYQNGLIYRAHGQSISTRWDEIESYIQDTACRITKKDGRVIQFGANIVDGDEAAQKIHVQTLRHMLPEMKAELRKGGSVEFKGLKFLKGRFPARWLNRFAYATSGFRVDSQGIAALDGGASIAWEDVTDYGLGEARMGRMPVSVFFIQSSTTRLQSRAGLLGNANLLLALCAAMKKAQADGQAAASS